MGVESFHTAMRQNVGFSDHNNNIEEGKLRFFPPGVQLIYPTSNYIPVPVCGYGALSPSPVAADLFHSAPGYTQSGQLISAIDGKGFCWILIDLKPFRITYRIQWDSVL
uniref:Uncharacterized protein n=1 Tax=Heterorhabditis bacteriophora TaxID=37862 RepID=A0A1I7X6T0_HETBA